MRTATEIIVDSIIVDRTSKNEIQRLMAGCSTLQSKAAAVERYCDRHLKRNIPERLRVEVIPTLIRRASWEDIARKLDEVFEREQPSPSKIN